MFRVTKKDRLSRAQLLSTVVKESKVKVDPYTRCSMNPKAFPNPVQSYLLGSSLYFPH